MSRSLLLLVVVGLFAGACLLAQSIIASQRMPIDPGWAGAVRFAVPPPPIGPAAVEPSLPDVCPPPDLPPEVESAPSSFVGRSWGQEQACGPPDSLQGGDVATAWASATADGRNEWLELTYAEPVRPIAVLVYENCAPGALAQIELTDATGEWITVWGDDPKPYDQPTRIVNAPIDADVATSRVRVSILSTLVPYWNEIDAVGLLDEYGKVHWAVAATASSSYAGDSSEPLPPQ